MTETPATYGTTRPLRHADDREQERANIEYERALLIQRLGWLDAVLAAMETRQRGGDPPAQGQSDSDRRHQVGIGRPPEGWAPEGGE